MAMQSRALLSGICRSARNLQAPSCTLLPWKLTRNSSSCNGLGKIFELRIYQIWPKDMKPFIELSKEWIHLRTVHSPLVGYWVSEIGGLNDVVHIWEYDDLNQRASVRQALAGDPHWISSYFSKILPMMSRQENMLLQTVGDSNLVQPDLRGVYELDTIKQGTGHQFTANKGDAKLLGTFQSILGPTDTGYQLWFHTSAQQVVENQIKGYSAGLPTLPSAVEDWTLNRALSPPRHSFHNWRRKSPTQSSLISSHDQQDYYVVKGKQLLKISLK